MPLGRVDLSISPPHLRQTTTTYQVPLLLYLFPNPPPCPKQARLSALSHHRSKRQASRVQWVYLQSTAATLMPYRIPSSANNISKAQDARTRPASVTRTKSAQHLCRMTLLRKSRTNESSREVKALVMYLYLYHNR